jgi:SAM-dependent methyltransferase
MSSMSFDPVWNERYESGLFPRAPYDFVVSFIYRHASKGVPRSKVKILEVGCGGGNNLWFAAMEGFSVAGIDASAAAIKATRKRLDEFDLEGYLGVGDFTSLPFDGDVFDMVIDRGALTCCGTKSIMQTIGEVCRVLHKGGAFLFNPLADTDSSYRAGQPGDDDVMVNIQAGDHTNVGQLRFVSRRDIDMFLPGAVWETERIERVEITDMKNPLGKIIANWRVEARKK